jgi:hypothetical protein
MSEEDLAAAADGLDAQRGRIATAPPVAGQ